MNNNWKPRPEWRPVSQDEIDRALLAKLAINERGAATLAMTSGLLFFRSGLRAFEHLLAEGYVQSREGEALLAGDEPMFLISLTSFGRHQCIVMGLL